MEGLPESAASPTGHRRDKIIKKGFPVSHQVLSLLQNAFRRQPLPSIPTFSSTLVQPSSLPPSSPLPRRCLEARSPSAQAKRQISAKSCSP